MKDERSRKEPEPGPGRLLRWALEAVVLITVANADRVIEDLVPTPGVSRLIVGLGLIIIVGSELGWGAVASFARRRRAWASVVTVAILGVMSLLGYGAYQSIKARGQEQNTAAPGDEPQPPSSANAQPSTGQPSAPSSASGEPLPSAPPKQQTPHKEARTSSVPRSGFPVTNQQRRIRSR